MTSIIDHSLHTSVVFRHTQNILEHFVDGKGTFAGMAHPTEIIFAGYSYGAGTIDRLMENWNDTKLKDVSVAATAYIDGVQLGVANFGHGIDVRPNHSHQHLHIWQDDTGALPPGSGPIHGEGLGFVLDDRGDYREYVANNGDREVFLEQSNHLDVDNNDRTFREIKDLLEGKLDILLQLP
jgi:hypothetical protein